tara:strand:- start:412 stop:519 length:108 start_codon:yes stop_codon:yes gene_type:complete
VEQPHDAEAIGRSENNDKDGGDNIREEREKVGFVI